MIGMDVLFDANFLVLPFQFNVPVFDELDRLLGDYETYTLNRTYNEALQVEDGAYRARVERFVDAAGITVIDTEQDGTVDEILLRLSTDYIICTNDRRLREQLRDLNRPHIYLRQQQYLVAENLPPTV